jgi:GT2 family glycosyltransferase
VELHFVEPEKGQQSREGMPPRSVTIVILTYNRVGLLQQCVERVLMRTSSNTKEIVIWNNGSTDGTREYLESLRDPRIRLVHHANNIGQNAYAEAFEQTSGDYLVEVDDDVIDAPDEWDATLLDAFTRLPEIGYLAANLVDNPLDWTAKKMYGEDAHLYSYPIVNGVKLKIGPTGGGCTMTSRELYNRVGGFKQHKKFVFWYEDAAYIKDIEKIGYRAAYIDDLKVLHAGGAHYSEITPEKLRYWSARAKIQARKNAIKRGLLWVPWMKQLNERFGWFHPPHVEDA